MIEVAALFLFGDLQKYISLMSCSGGEGGEVFICSGGLCLCMFMGREDVCGRKLVLGINDGGLSKFGEDGGGLHQFKCCTGIENEGVGGKTLSTIQK